MVSGLGLSTSAQAEECLSAIAYNSRRNLTAGSLLHQAVLAILMAVFKCHAKQAKAQGQCNGHPEVRRDADDITHGKDQQQANQADSQVGYVLAFEAAELYGLVDAPIDLIDGVGHKMIFLKERVGTRPSPL